MVNELKVTNEKLRFTIKKVLTVPTSSIANPAYEKLFKDLQSNGKGIYQVCDGETKVTCIASAIENRMRSRGITNWKISQRVKEKAVYVTIN